MLNYLIEKCTNDQTKQYTKEFKLDAVSLVTEQSYIRAEAARRLEINTNMLTRWVKELADPDRVEDVINEAKTKNALHRRAKSKKIQHYLSA